MPNGLEAIVLRFPFRTLLLLLRLCFCQEYFSDKKTKKEYTNQTYTGLLFI
jgi:hypothetical protein